MNRHYDIIILGDNVGGRSFRAHAAHLGLLDRLTCLTLEIRDREKVASKPCGSLLTRRARTLMNWPESLGTVYRSIRFRFGDEQITTAFTTSPVVITDRGAVLDHLERLGQALGDRTECRYGIHLSKIDFAGRTIRLPTGEDLHYTWLVIASGVKGKPTDELAQYLNKGRQDTVQTCQYRFPAHGRLPLTLAISSNYGGGYAWAWQDGDMLDIGAVVTWKPDPGSSDLDRLVRTFAKGIGISIPAGCKAQKWDIPFRWQGINPLPGVLLIGDAAGSPFRLSGEGLPQAVLTAKVAALLIAGKRAEANAVLYPFLLRKGISNLAMALRSGPVGGLLIHTLCWAVVRGGWPLSFIYWLYGI